VVCATGGKTKVLEKERFSEKPHTLDCDPPSRYCGCCGVAWEKEDTTCWKCGHGDYCEAGGALPALR